VVTKAHERNNPFFLGRMQNTFGWFHRDLGDAVRAVEYDQESVEMGRTAHTPHVEISALVNVGLDYLALGQYAHASSFLTSTLDRVEHEAFGSHRWQWKMKLCIGLAEMSYATEDYEQALRYVEEGLQEAQATHVQKYMALGRALRGKIAAKLVDPDAAGTELQRAFALAEQLQSPSLIYPIAHDLGQWHASTGQEREAASCYGKAKALIAQMAVAIGDETLRATFLQSALVQEIHERAARLGE
jgi:tetratricopeptide (TPR) repeat protein